MRLRRRGRKLRNEQRPQKKPVRRQLNRANVAVAVRRRHFQAAGFERRDKLRIHAEAAPELLDRFLAAKYRVESRSGTDPNTARFSHQRTTQPADEKRRRVRRSFFVFGVMDSEHVASELDDRVLKSPGRSKEDAIVLAGITNRRQSAVRAGVRTARRTEESVEPVERRTSRSERVSGQPFAQDAHPERVSRVL